MRRHRTKLGLVFLASFLAWAPGCVTIGLWGAATSVGESTSAERVQRARLASNFLELIVDYDELGPHLVRIDLSAATLGFYEGHPTYRAQIEGSQEADLPPGQLEVEEDGSLGDFDEATRAGGARPSGFPPNEAEGDAPPQPDRLYWTRSLERDGLILCLRRPGQEPLYAEVQALEGSSVATGFVYVGAGIVTPVTFAVDVATFPFQVVLIFVLADAIDDIFN